MMFVRCDRQFSDEQSTKTVGSSAEQPAQTLPSSHEQPAEIVKSSDEQPPKMVESSNEQPTDALEYSDELPPLMVEYNNDKSAELECLSNLSFHDQICPSGILIDSLNFEVEDCINKESFDKFGANFEVSGEVSIIDKNFNEKLPVYKENNISNDSLKEGLNIDKELVYEEFYETKLYSKCGRDSEIRSENLSFISKHSYNKMHGKECGLIKNEEQVGMSIEGVKNICKKGKVHEFRSDPDLDLTVSKSPNSLLAWRILEEIIENIDDNSKTNADIGEKEGEKLPIISRSIGPSKVLPHTVSSSISEMVSSTETDFVGTFQGEEQDPSESDFSKNNKSSVNVCLRDPFYSFTIPESEASMFTVPNQNLVIGEIDSQKLSSDGLSGGINDSSSSFVEPDRVFVTPTKADKSRYFKDVGRALGCNTPKTKFKKWTKEYEDNYSMSIHIWCWSTGFRLDKVKWGEHAEKLTVEDIILVLEFSGPLGVNLLPDGLDPEVLFKLYRNHLTDSDGFHRHSSSCPRLHCLTVPTWLKNNKVTPVKNPGDLSQLASPSDPKELKRIIRQHEEKSIENEALTNRLKKELEFNSRVNESLAVQPSTHPEVSLPKIDCPFCDKKFSRRDNLVRHVKDHHPGVVLDANYGLEKVTCYRCGEKKSRKFLTSHLRICNINNDDTEDVTKLHGYCIPCKRAFTKLREHNIVKHNYKVCVHCTLKFGGPCTGCNHAVCSKCSVHGFCKDCCTETDKFGKIIPSNHSTTVITEKGPCAQCAEGGCSPCDSCQKYFCKKCNCEGLCLGCIGDQNSVKVPESSKLAPLYPHQKPINLDHPDEHPFMVDRSGHLTAKLNHMSPILDCVKSINEEVEVQMSKSLDLKGGESSIIEMVTHYETRDLQEGQRMTRTLENYVGPLKRDIFDFLYRK